MQGSTPKDLAIQFQKQSCVEFLELAETEVDELGYEDCKLLICLVPCSLVGSECFIF